MVLLGKIFCHYLVKFHFHGKPFSITVIQVYAPTSNAEEAEVEQFYEDLQDLLELTPPKRCALHYRGLECKSRSQEKPGITGRFGLGVQHKAGQRLTKLCQENARSLQTLSLTTQEMTLHMDITIGQYWSRLIIFFAAKDGEALYSQQKQDQELTVAQIMNSLLPHSDSN